MKKKRRSKRARLIKWLVIIAIIALIPVFLLYQNNHCTVSTYKIKSSKLSNSHNFIFLSDLHITQDRRFNERVIEICKEKKPEVIFMTGDLVDINTFNPEAVNEFARKLGKIARVYWVTGNHEAALSSSDFKDLKRELLECGFVFMDNTTKKLQLSEDVIKISGLADPLMMDKDGSPIYEPLNDLEGTKSFSILLHHRAEAMPALFEYDFNLFLTGHAHGGQIILPFLGPLFAPGQGAFPKYTEGLWVKDEKNADGIAKVASNAFLGNKHGIISRGIGASRFKYRVFNLPEIISLELSGE